MSSDKKFSLVLSAILLGFFLIFAFKSLFAMQTIPFNEFDEAHRAETAKLMMEYRSYLVPLSGSSYDRVVTLRTQMKTDPFKFLYYHLERPPFVYDLMVISASFLGPNKEFGYRLPSFILGMLTFLIFLLFIKIFSRKVNFWALLVSFVCLITASDIWLSSQYAQLDTGLTFFIFLSVLSLMTYVERRREAFLLLAGLSFSLAILSKGQPAVFLAPVPLFLLITRRIDFKEFFRFLVYSSLISLPWFLYMGTRFGFGTFLGVFAQFAFLISTSDVVYHKAPIFWYARWWLETFRPGWTIFLALLSIDFIRRNFDWKKQTLLVFIVFDFIFLSVQSDKLWWYVMLLIPEICLFIYFSLQDYLKSNHLIINLSLVLIIASRSPVIGLSNTQAIFFGIFFLFVCFYLLYGLNISKIDSHLRKFPKQVSSPDVIFTIAISFSLFTFLTRFPKIIPYDWNFKPISQSFANLPGRKCLWAHDIPTESILFYSDTGETYTYNSVSRPFGHCTNYLMSDSKIENFPLVMHDGDILLYKFTPQSN